MSPELNRRFEAEWPLLARRLNSLLARKQVPLSQREDLIQETAMRLYAIWERVDQNRPAWALTATIALNLMRDQGRRMDLSQTIEDVPELACAEDVEQVALARVELHKVKAAIARMSVEHRSVLLAEIGVGPQEAESNALKMRRHRARRKLRRVLERAMALIIFPARRISDVAQGILSLREGLGKSAACLACMFVGTGSLVSVPFDVVRVAPDAEISSSDVVSAATDPLAASAATTSVGFGDDPVVDDATFLASAERSGSERGSRGGGGGETEQGTAPGSVESIPGSGGGTPSTPPVELPEEPETPPVPNVDPGEPEAPPLPGTPVPPGQGGEDETPDVDQVVAEIEAAVESGAGTVDEDTTEVALDA